MTLLPDPIEIGSVTLRTRNAEALSAFYERVLGLTRIHSDAGDGAELRLGVGDVPLLHLRTDPHARPAPQEAGLFHTAFLLPSRSDLGAWLTHAAGLEQRLDGASDHLVSEALYLRDPEGNGIEIYADRPRDTWQTDGETVVMDSLRLDLDELAASAPAPWAGIPEGSKIGHVHLQVGDVAMADDFYTGTLPLHLSAAWRDQARFYASGGYHHHLAGNIWNSKGAGRRSDGASGLIELELRADAAAATPGLYTDPWGTDVRITAKA